MNMYIDRSLICILVKEYVHIYKKSIILIIFNLLKINYLSLSGISVSMNEWANYISCKLLQDTILADPISQYSLLAERESFFHS